MKAGDRVKLTARAARGVSRGLSNFRRTINVDWSARRGTIKSIGTNGAIIQWDDRRTPDQWPKIALEIAGT